MQGTTAFGAYMAAGGEYLAGKSDEEIIAEAISVLATRGQGEDALREHAFVVAIPEIERLEKTIAIKEAQQARCIDQLLRPNERKDAVKARGKA